MPLPRVHHLLALAGGFSFFALLAGACAPPSQFMISGGDEEAQMLPEDPSAWPEVAPGGYFVWGNTIYTHEGAPHVFRGVARPSLEWQPDGEFLSAEDYQRMASWNAKVVRIALNQGFWLEDSAFHDPTYPARIDENIAWAQQAGMDVILDLHWSDRGDPTVKPNQQFMADERSLLFWQSVASRYKHDGRIIFELYNEPHSVSWDVWLNGGLAGPAAQIFTAVGMQALYDAVRSTGAHNLVLIGGLDYAFLLNRVPEHLVEGYNIAYASHPYNLLRKEPPTWDMAFGDLAKTHPVVLTEFGDFSCSGEYYGEVIDYAEARGISWVAWAWWAGNCDFPSIIADWEGTPSPAGVFVHDALMRHGG